MPQPNGTPPAPGMRLGPLGLWLPPAPAPPRPEPLTLRLIDGRRMQCKDIPDATFLDAVRATPGLDDRPNAWRMRWDVQATLEAVIGPLPEKLFLAKASRLKARGLLGGCDCGCRGDYHLTADCTPYCCERRRSLP